MLGQWSAKRPTHVHYQLRCLLAAWQAHVTYCAWSLCSSQHATEQCQASFTENIACNYALLKPYLAAARMTQTHQAAGQHRRKRRLPTFAALAP